jgi:voltage-gated potassium channel
MAYIGEAGAAIVLVTLTLLLQCAGTVALIHWLKPHLSGMNRLGLMRSGVLIVRFMSLIVVLHLLEILLWAALYRRICFPSWESAVYFSAASYSTVGYGDLVLPKIWRNLGPVEGITGVLMCGLSAAFLFAVVTRLIQREELLEPEPGTNRGHRAFRPAPSGASQWTARRR